MADNDPSKHGMRSAAPPVDDAPSSLSGRSPAKERATKRPAKAAERSDEEAERELREAHEAKVAEKVAADVAKMWPSNE